MRALSLGFTGQADAVKYLWQVALEEIEGSMQHEYAKKFVQIVEEQSKRLRQKYLEIGGEGAKEVLDAVIKDIEWAKKK
jgi:hypothetical protein